MAANQENQAQPYNYMSAPPGYESLAGDTAPLLYQQMLATRQQNMLQPLQEITKRIDQLETQLQNIN